MLCDCLLTYSCCVLFVHWVTAFRFPADLHIPTTVTKPSPSSLHMDPNSTPARPGDHHLILPIRDLPASSTETERRRTTSTPPTPVPHSSVAMRPTASDNGISGIGVGGGSPRRGNSLRRKPVPTLHMPQPLPASSSSSAYPLPNDRLPSNHPFARPQPSPTGSMSSARTGKLEVPSGLGTPSGSGSRRWTPEDLGSRRTPPPPPQPPPAPPPQRKTVNNAAAPAIPPRNASRGQPQELEEAYSRSSTPGLSVEGSAPARRGRTDDDVSIVSNPFGRQQQLQPEQALQARLVSLSLDRPLPPLPNNGQETDPADVRERSEHFDHRHRRRRSVSADSPVLPTTPRDPRSETWDIAHEINVLDPGIAPPNSVKMSREASSGRAKLFRKDTHTLTEKDKGKSGKSGLSNEATKKGSKKDANVIGLEEEEFDVDRIPSKRRLWEAGTCFLKDEDGKLVCFGDFFPRSNVTVPLTPTTLNDKQNPATRDTSQRAPIPSSATEKTFSEGQQPKTNSNVDVPRATSDIAKPTPKTVIFFIRHFWCGQCQDYTFASLSLLDPVALEKAGIRVIIISNGSWKIIKTYKRLFKCPFPIYVDGPRRLYQLMGMTKMTNDFGPLFRGRAAYHQRAVPGQLVQSLTNIFRMPLANPGTLTQLGGEFILSPGWNCDFAHRMSTTSDHMEAPDVLRLAGCAHPTKSEVSAVELAESQREELERLETEMQEWRDSRNSELERIQKKKAARRGIPYKPSRHNSQISLSMDVDAELDHLDEDSAEMVSERTEADAPWVEEQEQFQVDKDELDARFERVMREEEERAKERVAAGELMLTRDRRDL
ncbi:hypothetical protein IAR55_006062 [Kwoniella newhampshirensis]|uniref:Thioredoxin domain-containing protein n=1 Tax=Kwoniella newhampshirensis TaxID=1651941 RepID=A0AAW0YJN1_9TREE